ncbi:MAG: two pore domain potassium channel family protein [Deltaproteobacteria bacterium]|nr:two pore domain potassium channel family protein [Deltaproteobacteria bacterium]
MKLSRLNPRQLWSDESGLTTLLVLTLVFIISLTTLSDYSFGRILIRLFFCLIVVVGVLTTFPQKWLHAFALALAVAIVAVNFTEHFQKLPYLEMLNTGLSLVYVGLLLFTLVFQVFREGSVTRHRISGAIVLYLFLGAFWALLYKMLALNVPQAFHLSEHLIIDHPDDLLRHFMYFSYITLTTTGYGDITPVHPVARLLAMFQALAGQLFLVITLARLVSLELMHRNEKTDSQ